MREGGLHLNYDLALSCGWAAWKPGMDAPAHGIIPLPSPTAGNIGQALVRHEQHIRFIERELGPIAGLSYEWTPPPSGKAKTKPGAKPDEVVHEDAIRTNMRTLKIMLGLSGNIERMSAVLGVPCEPINNASWRRVVLGKQPFGTKKPKWKELSKAWAAEMGLVVKGDDDADALGQLTYRLIKLNIWHPWRDAAIRGALFSGGRTVGQSFGIIRRRAGDPVPLT